MPLAALAVAPTAIPAEFAFSPRKMFHKPAHLCLADSASFPLLTVRHSHSPFVQCSTLCVPVAATTTWCSSSSILQLPCLHLSTLCICYHHHCNCIVLYGRKAAQLQHDNCIHCRTAAISASMCDWWCASSREVVPTPRLPVCCR